MRIRRLLLVVFDVLLLLLSYAVSYTVSCFSSVLTIGRTLPEYFVNFLIFTIFIFTARFLFKVYSNVWRYANTRAYIFIVISDFLGGFAAIVLTRYIFSVWGFMIYVSIWNSFTNVMFFCLFTLVSRFVYQYSINVNLYAQKDINRKNVAIVGAGRTGSLLVEELLYNTNSPYRPICFIDNDHARIGNYISGIKIIGDDDVIKKIKLLNIHEIFIALPSLSAAEAKTLYDFYSKTGCKIKLYDFAMGEKSHDMSDKRILRDFKIDDLLFRETYNINSNDTVVYYTNKTVLVTGGGGSIGSEICRQIAKTKPKKLVVFDIYENNVYDIQQEFRRIYGDKLEFCAEIGSVRDYKRLEAVFEKHRPDVVFHAAAHKHVPLMENSSSEAIKNNVFGTYNTANCAEKFGVRRFIMISTDKAVNPTNVMGASKRLCEMIVQSRYDSKITEFAAVRFGNVLGSNGSVIPLFQSQIMSGGPVTITDKRIIRYFMTIPEASQLVLEAGVMASNGELFVLDMGNPVRILDLAENMIKLAGFVPYKDIDIVETGLRPGEKLYEELLIKSEDLKKTDNEMIFIETDKPYTRQEIDNMLEELRAVLNSDNNEVKKVLKKIIKTYNDPSIVNKNAEQSEEMKRTYNSPKFNKVEL